MVAEPLTALPVFLPEKLSVSRRVGTGLVFLALGLIVLLVFGLTAPHGVDVRLNFYAQADQNSGPHLTFASLPALFILGSLCAASGLYQLVVGWQRRGTNWATTGVLLGFVIALLVWGVATGGVATGGTPPYELSLVDLVSTSFARSIPLVLGALAGVLGERSGVINVAIEGQMLTGAFSGALVGSMFGSGWIGVLAAAAGGALIGLILALFAIRFMVDQVILGVVLNVFASGITGFLFDRLMVPNADTLNSVPTFSDVTVPGLNKIPIIGPLFFEENPFFYLAVAALLAVHFGLFHTRWGLRTRAVGEHPRAADTMGIRVLGLRYRNVIIGGVLAGIAGAYLTVGTVGSFNKDMSSGKGFIALAALIFGRWSPMGSLAAALLFGFADALQTILSILGAPIPTQLLAMLPYLVTILAVAGLVGRVRAPGADGKPYVKQ